VGDNFLDLHFDFVREEGLDQIIKGPFLHGLNRGIYRGIGCHHEYLRLCIHFFSFKPFQGLNPIHTRHFQIQQNHVPVLLPGHGNGFFTACSQADLIAFLHQPVLKRFSHWRFIINDKNTGLFGHCRFLPFYLLGIIF